MYFKKSVQPFFEKNCYACHSAALSTAGLNLESYKTPQSIADNRDKYELVLKRLKAGEMPPAGMPRPADTELATVTNWIQSEFARTDASVQPLPGRVTARRLNRAEYNNTVRDPFAVDFHPADDFPQDDSCYGFDIIGDALSLSPVLMEKSSVLGSPAADGVEVLESESYRVHARVAGGANRIGAMTHCKKTGGADIRAGVSVDQIAARAVESATRFPSLELGGDDTRTVGECDSGYSCAYQNTLSWRTPTSPIPPEVNPRTVFERLFGTEDLSLSAAERSRRNAERKSILHLVSEDTLRLQANLGRTDRASWTNISMPYGRSRSASKRPRKNSRILFPRSISRPECPYFSPTI